jgi:hypothetical protein
MCRRRRGVHIQLQLSVRIFTCLAAGMGKCTQMIYTCLTLVRFIYTRTPFYVQYILIGTRLWLRLINSGDIPSARRAQSACFSESHGGIFVFGGGDGKTALNDLYFLRLQPRGSPSDTASYITPVWERWETGGEIPHGRGFHSMHLVNNRLLLVGGGDGSEYFPGIYTLDLGVLFLV